VIGNGALASVTIGYGTLASVTRKRRAMRSLGHLTILMLCADKLFCEHTVYQNSLAPRNGTSCLTDQGRLSLLISAPG